MLQGLTKPDAERCIDLLASYKKFFVDLMMTEELTDVRAAVGCGV